jgi:hypothetical protein
MAPQNLKSRPVKTSISSPPSSPRRFDQRAMLVARKNDSRAFREIGGRWKDLPFQDFRQNIGYAQRIPYGYRNMMNHRLFSPFSNLVILSTPLFGDVAEDHGIRFSGWFRSLRHAPS